MTDSDQVRELSMKVDRKLPNLKVPVKGKKGTSKYSRAKAMKAVDDLNAEKDNEGVKEKKLMSFKDMLALPTVDEDPDMEEALSVGGRRKLARTMKRRKGQLKRARKRAQKRMASKDVLKKRARRSTRSAIANKLTKGKAGAGKLSIAQKKSIEKRMAGPALQKKIGNLTKRLLPQKRRDAIARKR